MRILLLVAAVLPHVTGFGIITAAAADTVKFTMTESHVDPGETVEFTITNHRDETIWLNGFPYWGCWDESGEHGGPCVGVPGLYPLGAGQSETNTWNQIDCFTGLPVPPGLYRVQATWSSSSQPLFQTAEAAFCIGGGPECSAVTSIRRGVESSTWGAVRGRYR